MFTSKHTNARDERRCMCMAMKMVRDGFVERWSHIGIPLGCREDIKMADWADDE